MFRLPKDTQRISILGKTGSGKTQAALWQLSMRSFDKRPWIIFDFKHDDAINEIEGAEYIPLGQVPKHAGLYIVQPNPHQNEAVEATLWEIWRRENIGIYFDEGYMVGNSPALRAILTQGRSKRIPVIILSQRPVWLSRFVFSEADFFQVFWLNDFRDRKTVQSFVPFNLEKRLPDYHSVWYDVGSDKVFVMRPVPEKEQILATFSARLKTDRKRVLI